MKLTLKKRLGAWVMYDENGNAMYIMEEDLGKIVDIYAPTGKKIPSTIVLPEINFDLMEHWIKNKKAVELCEKNKVQPLTEQKELLEFITYMHGCYQVECLEPFTEDNKQCKVIVPVKSSICLRPWCFSSSASVTVELVLPEDMDVKYAYLRDDEYDYEEYNYLLIAHKDFTGKNTYKDGRSLIVEDYAKHCESCKDAEKKGETKYLPIIGFPNIVISKDKLVEKDGTFVYKTADKIYTKKTEDETDATHVKK